MFPFLRDTIQAAEDLAVKNAIARVITERTYFDFLENPSVLRFEKELSRYLQNVHVLGVDSGTDALILALKLLGIGKGDEVIVPAFSFIGTVSCLPWIGATPIFVDIREDDYAIDPVKIEEKITTKTKAIIVVHLFGQPSLGLEHILRIAKERSLYVVEDAAQSFGARISINGEWKSTGTLGDIGCFSFSSSKILAAPGRGGALAIRDKSLWEEANRIRFFGARHHYRDYPTVGINAKLQELQAAALLEKFQFFEYWLWQRKKIASFYTHQLKELDTFVLPQEYGSTERIWYRYPIRTKKRDKLFQFLNPFMDKPFYLRPLITYPVPLPYFSIFQNFGHKPGDFPVADKISTEIFSLPLANFVSTLEAKEICNEVKKFFLISDNT